MNSVELIKCDVNNEEMVRAMCERTRLVIDCVGPVMIAFTYMVLHR